MSQECLSRNPRINHGFQSPSTWWPCSVTTSRIECSCWGGGCPNSSSPHLWTPIPNFFWGGEEVEDTPHYMTCRRTHDMGGGEYKAALLQVPSYNSITRTEGGCRKCKAWKGYKLLFQSRNHVERCLWSQNTNLGKETLLIRQTYEWSSLVVHI